MQQHFIAKCWVSSDIVNAISVFQVCSLLYLICRSLRWHGPAPLLSWYDQILWRIQSPLQWGSMTIISQVMDVDSNIFRPLISSPLPRSRRRGQEKAHNLDDDLHYHIGACSLRPKIALVVVCLERFTRFSFQCSLNIQCISARSDVTYC